MATQVASIKWMPSTSDRRFIVDGFNFQTPSCRTYFLTHYHSDHTTGLSRGFSSGTIYTSEVTARLLIHDMGIKPHVICALPMHTPIMIEGCRVMLLNANHCPGAVMLLVEVMEGGPRKVLLHTGDCRWAEGMADQIPAGVRVDEIFLDTTYCMPRHSFPPQQQVIQGLVQEIQVLGGQPLTPNVGSQSKAGDQSVLNHNSSLPQKAVDQSPTDHSNACTLDSPSANPKIAALSGCADNANFSQQQQQQQQHLQRAQHQQQQQERAEQLNQQQQQQLPDVLDRPPSLDSNVSVQTTYLPSNIDSPPSIKLNTGSSMAAIAPAAGAELTAAEYPQLAHGSDSSSSSSGIAVNGNMAGPTLETYGPTATNLSKSGSIGHASPMISADTLIVVAAYRIGKERVFLGLARALGVKVWCSPAKRRVLAQLGLSADDWALLTDDPFQAQLHVVSWGMKPEALHRKYLGATTPTLTPQRSRLTQSIQTNTLPPHSSQPLQITQPKATASVHAAHQVRCHGLPALGVAESGSREGGACQERGGLGAEECEAEEFEEDEGCAAWDGKDEDEEEGDLDGALNSPADSAKGGSLPSHVLAGSSNSSRNNSGSNNGYSSVGVDAAGGRAALEGGDPELRGRPQCRRVIGIRPTGWSFRPRARSLFSRWSLGAVTVISAPYSEHSSFTELCACVKALRPTKIIPTVNAATPAEARAIINRFAPLMDLSRDRSRLDMYLLPPQPALAVHAQQHRQQEDVPNCVNSDVQQHKLEVGRQTAHIQLQQHKQHDKMLSSAHSDLQQHGREEVDRQGVHSHLQQHKRHDERPSSAHTGHPEHIQGGCSDEQATQKMLSRIDLAEQQRIWDQLQAARVSGSRPSGQPTSKPSGAVSASRQQQTPGKRQASGKQQHPSTAAAKPSQAKPSSSHAAKQHPSKVEQSSSSGSNTSGKRQLHRQKGQHVSQKQQPQLAPPSSSYPSSSWQSGEGGKGQKRPSAVPLPVGCGSEGSGKKQRSLHAFFSCAPAVPATPWPSAAATAAVADKKQQPVSPQENGCGRESEMDVICID